MGVLAFPETLSRTASFVADLPRCEAPARPLAAAPSGRRRVYPLASIDDAAVLSLAYRRFTELRGRSAATAGGRASFVVLEREAVVMFWNARAARLFDIFWPRYRRTYVELMPGL